MFEQKTRLFRYLRLFFSAFIVLLLVSIIPWMASAEPAADVLPRQLGQSSVDTKGAWIELRVHPLREGLWTQVQWQDPLGHWYDVDGWKGTFSEKEQSVLWYVGEELLEKGPFRWQVFEHREGALLATSLPFNLPDEQGHKLEISMTLPVSAGLSATSSGQPAPTIRMFSGETEGAFIELQANPLRGGLWTQVQWQDALGGWHDVDGWRGSFSEEEQSVLWYVGKQLLGAGQFRWQVFEQRGGAPLSTSLPFYLPVSKGQILEVKVNLPDGASIVPTGTSVSADSERTYTVQPGDTLAKIASQHHTSISVLATINDIDNIDLIYVGQRLIIPAG
jgi:LysM repeat protein